MFIDAAKSSNFSGRILLLGFGSIGVAVLPILLEKLTTADKIHIIAKDSIHWDVATSYGISYDEKEITHENYNSIFSDYNLSNGDFVINLTVEVGCTDLILYCNSVGAFYIDTCIEPWQNFYTDDSLTTSEKSNYALREGMLAIKSQTKGRSTAVVAQGANPGLVNQLTKRALIELSAKLNKNITEPKSQNEWAELAKTLGVKTIQISERDTQYADMPKKRDTFYNTWSIDGFIAEGVFQPAELGWGTHESKLPDLGEKHSFGCDSAIYINKPGVSVKVKGWTPDEGPYHGFMVTHNESIGIADYFTQKDSNGTLIYRPTVFYCYHPCDYAVLSVYEILGKDNKEQKTKIIMRDEIVSGVDELGILLIGDFGDFTGYWHGSNLSIHEARKLLPQNTATSLQVVAGLYSAMVWAIENPNRGLVEPDELDYKRILELADPYLGNIVSKTTEYFKSFDINDFIV